MIEHIPPGAAYSLGHYAPLMAAPVFLILWGFETVMPLRRRKLPVRRRLASNFGMSALALAVGAVIGKLVSANLALWTSSRCFGLLHVFPLPSVVQFVIGFLLLDLTFYYWHKLNHVVPVLWRFHNVHHVDPDLDVTTSFRFHVVEVLYSAGFRAAQIGLIGVAPLTYVVYELVFQLATMFHHSNWRLPVRFEKWANRVFVTPRMHGIHHSAVREETNSNYSVVFRWWDVLNGSLWLNIRQSDITIGVAAYQDPADNGLWNLVKLPFLKQRAYGRFPDGRVEAREASLARDRRVMLE